MRVRAGRSPHLSSEGCGVTVCGRVLPTLAAVSADLAVHSQIEAAAPPHFEIIDHGGALPALVPIRINMYLADGPKRPLIERLAEVVRNAYRDHKPRLALAGE